MHQTELGILGGPSPHRMWMCANGTRWKIIYEDPNLALCWPHEHSGKGDFSLLVVKRNPHGRTFTIIGDFSVRRWTEKVLPELEGIATETARLEMLARRSPEEKPDWSHLDALQEGFAKLCNQL